MSYLADNYFTYDASFGKHSVNVMAGNSLQWGDSWYMNGQKKGFLSDNASQFNNGTEIESLNGNRSDWAIASFMGRANWSYDNRYMLTATVRADGSSKFGPGHRWGIFLRRRLARERGVLVPQDRLVQLSETPSGIRCYR
jgi:hypothetical protein